MRVVLFFMTCLSLISCTQSKNGGLLSDLASLSDCPQNSCAQGIADASETKILLQTPINNVLPLGSSFAEISGDCYASLFASNFFEVSIKYNGAAVSNYFPAGFIPRCNQGKFYFPVSLEGGPAGSYSLTAQLVVVDSQGIETRPPFKSITSTLIVR